MKLTCLFAAAAVLASQASAPAWAQGAVEANAIIDLSAARTGEGAARTFPLTLRKREVSGAALVECRVSAKAGLEDCIVLGETPAGGDVGAGAIKLLSLAKVVARPPGAALTTGAYIIYPMVFRWPDKPNAETPFFPGEPAYIVTRSAIGQPTGSIGCPTATDAAARCFLHPVLWGWPPLSELAPSIRKVGKTTGESSMDCRYDAQRRLGDCRGSPDLDAAQVATLAEMLGRFPVRATTADGVAVANTRLVAFFDWPQINRTLSLSRLTRP